MSDDPFGDALSQQASNIPDPDPFGSALAAHANQVQPSQTPDEDIDVLDPEGAEARALMSPGTGGGISLARGAIKTLASPITFPADLGIGAVNFVKHLADPANPYDPNLLRTNASDLLNQALEKTPLKSQSGLPNQVLEGVGGLYTGLGMNALLSAPDMGDWKAPVAEDHPSVSDEILSTSRKVGYVVPPATTNPNFVNRGIEAFAGKASVAQAASIKNQAITNSLARLELGLPGDAPLTTDTMESVREPAGSIYDTIAQQGRMSMDPEYHQALDNLTAQSAQINKDLPNFSSGSQKAIKELTDSLRPESDQIDSSTAVELSKTLRSEANGNFAAAARTADPVAKNLAQAQSGAAKAVEDQVSRYLDSIGKGDLSDQWDNARQTIAKSYTVQNALDGAGNVDAMKIARQLKGKDYGGNLQTVRDFANAFPKAARVLPGKESMPGMSPLDVYGSVAASLASGSPVPMLLGPGRMAARSLALSKMFQTNPTLPPQ